MNKLPRALPAEVGIDPKAILAFVEEFEQIDGHSFMIMRHNKVVAEGWWYPYQQNYNHVIHSFTKSFTSIAVGFAIQEGLLALDDFVVAFFEEELPYEPCENMKKMKVRHLLTMSMGHEKENLNFIHSDNWIRECLTAYVEREPGSLFVYNNRASHLLSAIVQKLTGMLVFDYLKPRLFDPLEMFDIWWEVDPQKVNPGGFGLNMKTEDIAKFGTFLLNKGKWNGSQLISEQWIIEATSKQIDTANKNQSVIMNSIKDKLQGYGYHFWRCVPEEVYRCSGAFGQYCIVMPKQNMVIATTAGSQDAKILERIWDTLIPGMGDSVEHDAKAQEALEKKLANLELPTPTGNKSNDISQRYSDRIYQIAENGLNITKISFHFGEEDSITLWKGSDCFTAKIGYGRWLESKTGIETEGFGFPCLADFFPDVACAGAWDGDVYTLKMAYTRAADIDTIHVKFDDMGILAEYQRKPGVDWIKKYAFSLMGINA